MPLSQNVSVQRYSHSVCRFSTNVTTQQDILSKCQWATPLTVCSNVTNSPTLMPRRKPSTLPRGWYVIESFPAWTIQYLQGKGNQDADADVTESFPAWRIQSADMSRDRSLTNTPDLVEYARSSINTQDSVSTNRKRIDDLMIKSSWELARDGSRTCMNHPVHTQRKGYHISLQRFEQCSKDGLWHTAS